MSFSTNFQPIFQHSGDHYYDKIYSAFPEPPEARAQAELAHLNRALVVPEFADSTPLDLFDCNGVLVEAAPHSLGAWGHLPVRYKLNTLQLLVKSSCNFPSAHSAGTFQMSAAMCLQCPRSAKH